MNIPKQLLFRIKKYYYINYYTTNFGSDSECLLYDELIAGKKLFLNLSVLHLKRS